MVRVCALGLSLLLASSTAFAQVSATTGSINGKVTDTSGGVLPGVTITASSPSMQGTRTDVTNEAGEYRFPAVPPGTYKLVYELAGFGTVNREGVSVGLGFTATVNIELAVASLQETVTVSGESPVVDISSTTTAANFGEQRLSALPNARDFWAVLAASPAIVVTRIDVGGSAAGTQTGYAVYDTKEDQHRPMVEGIVNTEGTGAAGFYYDYGAIDEVAVQTKGHTAEMPWPGVWSNFVSKSGGAQFHGKFHADYQNKSIQRENIPNDFTFLCPGGRCGNLTPSDLNRMERYYDLNADVGGYVPGLQDKLWWYFSAREQDILTQVPNFPVKAFETRLRNLTGKLTYALSQNNKLTAYAQGGQKLQPNRMDRFLVAATVARHESEESTWEQRYWGHTYKAGYESVLGDNSFLELRGGQFKYEWPNFRYSEAPAYEDIGNQIVSGGNRDGWFNIPSRNQVAGSLTYYKDGWAGSHNFKVGGEWFRETFTYLRGDGVDGVFPGDVLHVLNNGVPAEVLLFQTPSRSEQGLRTTGMYIQDTWRLNSRLTLNVGLRFDRYRSFLPEQQGPSGGRFTAATPTQYAEVSNVKTFNHPVPRIGLIYDVTGQGRTVIKANYAQYFWNPGTDISNNLNPNSQDYYTRRVWTDRNGNRLYDPGEEGAINAAFGGVGTTSLDPNLKNTQTREISAWAEHELFPGIGLQGGYVFREIDDFRVRVNVNRPISAYNVPITLRDPGPDGVFGNGDDGANFQAFALSQAALSAPVVNQLTNLDGQGQYHTVEFGVNKRQTGRWSIAASLSKRWNRDHATTYFGQNLRSVTTPSTPNDLINTDDGQFRFSMWTAKINGTYEFPWQIRVTPALRFQSGQPFGRTVLATNAYGVGGTGGINYGSARILVEKIGTRKQDDIVIFDLRAEKYFTL
ncbi:MAG: TonB-dependent receptor, partial [Vicinamibacterales bacterium]